MGVSSDPRTNDQPSGGTEHLNRDNAVSLCEQLRKIPSHTPPTQVVAGLATFPDSASILAWRSVGDGMERWQALALAKNGLAWLQAANTNPDWAGNFDQEGDAFIRTALYRTDDVLAIESCSVDNLDAFDDLESSRSCNGAAKRPRRRPAQT